MKQIDLLICFPPFFPSLDIFLFATNTSQKYLCGFRCRPSYSCIALRMGPGCVFIYLGHFFKEYDFKEKVRC